ncbi:Circumsporozoite protein [Durusdinium trenchii]|uniref:Circumsporozoite protein n=1 Tax=Durusdinium trenchii TaxID=1381693 RepID=A0ABP0SFE1_9DINO
MPLWHAGALFASERLDFFAHPNGLLVFDQRFCLPRSSHPPDLRFNVRVDLHAPLAAEQPLRFWWLRPIQNIGWETMDESTFHVTEGLQSWQLANHAARGGDCLAWHSWQHGVVPFEEDPNAMAFLLLPGAQLQSHEILEHHHFAQVSRRYSMELRVEADAEAVLEAASGPQIKAMSCPMQELHWASSSLSGMQHLPEGDGVWSMGQRQLCLMSPENQFQRGRFHFLGDRSPLQFALCHPSCGNRGSPGSPRAEAEELLMRLAPAGSTQVLRRIEWQMAGEAEPYWCSLLLLLLPFFICTLADRLGAAQGSLRTDSSEHASLWACSLRLLCCLLSLLHLLMGLDIFCLPGPPTLLWRDLDALWGYATAHAMLALSAAFASRPVRGATDALGRFLRKWLRLAPAGLALRLLSASASEFTHARPQGSGWPERRGAMQHFNLDFRRCGTAVECVEPWKGWPFGLKDVLWAFPDVADVGWFLEVDLTNSLLLTLLNILECFNVNYGGVGRFLQRTLELGLCCASLDAWHVRDPRMPFDCQRPEHLPWWPRLFPHLCLNFTLAPLVAWFTRSRAVCASAVPHQGVLLRLSLALGVWCMDCWVMRSLDLGGGCYTGSGNELVEEPTSTLELWNLVRLWSLLLFHRSLLELLRGPPARPTSCSAGSRELGARDALRRALHCLDRLTFGVFIISPWLMRVIFFSWHASCWEFSYFALGSLWLGIFFSSLLASAVLFFCITVLGLVNTLPRLAEIRLADTQTLGFEIESRSSVYGPELLKDPTVADDVDVSLGRKKTAGGEEFETDHDRAKRIRRERRAAKEKEKDDQQKHDMNKACGLPCLRILGSCFGLVGACEQGIELSLVGFKLTE